MKALVVRQPYAEQIMAGEKSIEYRTWRTAHRGPLLIVASKRPIIGSLPVGCAVGIVELVDITGEPGDYCWHLAKPRRIKYPFPVRGQLRIMEVAMPPELRA
jgi:predicted transcriptional regulator